MKGACTRSFKKTSWSPSSEKRRPLRQRTCWKIWWITNSYLEEKNLKPKRCWESWQWRRMTLASRGPWMTTKTLFKASRNWINSFWRLRRTTRSATSQQWNRREMGPSSAYSKNTNSKSCRNKGIFSKKESKLWIASKKNTSSRIRRKCSWNRRGPGRTISTRPTSKKKCSRRISCCLTNRRDKERPRSLNSRWKCARSLGLL